MNRYRRYLPHLVAALVGGAMLRARLRPVLTLRFSSRRPGLTVGRSPWSGQGPVSRPPATRGRTATSRLASRVARLTMVLR